MTSSAAAGEKTSAPSRSEHCEQVPDKDAATTAGGGAVDGSMEWTHDDDDDDVHHGVVADHRPDSVSRLTVDRDRVLVVEDLSAAPDGGWGWMIVFVSFLCASVVDGLCSVFGVLLPDLVVYFEQSSSTVATAGSLLAGGFLLFGISFL